MRVIYMDGTYTDTVFTGASVALPPVPVPGCVQIGLYAGDIHTSRMALRGWVWWGRCADLPNDRGHGIHAARSMDCHHCPSVWVS